jgi:6-phosphogluconate dehydrogenase
LSSLETRVTSDIAMTQQADIGLIGLAVMGENLARNIERNGFPIAVYNRTPEKTREFIKKHGRGRRFAPATTLQQFVAALRPPRRIVVMVKAGPPVDAVIAELRPLLAAGDIIIDGGNSWFEDTHRRQADLAGAGIHFVGSGVSGGEEGALNGPSLMPGGDEQAYRQLEPIWTKIAAQVDDGPCCAYIGTGGAGHFVKMVHNGIEYGDMQLIAEAYDLLKNALGLESKQLARIFKQWNDGLLQSFLIDITAKVLKKKDDKSDAALVDMILDKAGQKGTGKWTLKVAADMDVPTPTMNAAVEARLLSSYKDERVAASKVLATPAGKTKRIAKKKFVAAVQDALYASKICSYAQGFVVMQKASQQFGWGLRLGEIARIWKGGCIIRAQFLDKIKAAYGRNPDLPNLLVDPEFAGWLAQSQENWRFVVSTAAQLGVPVLAMGASLSYYDSYRRERLPQNLTQAQRDFFGAHSYERVDAPGAFHTEW